MADFNIKKPIRLQEVPEIPRYLEPSDFMKLIPPGYEDLMDASLNDINPDKPSIQLRIKNAEMASANVVEIPLSYFNGHLAEVEVPLFLMETSTQKTGVDYFGKDKHLILNMNQLIYMVIQHRLASYVRVIGTSERKVYVSLLRTDLRVLRDFIQFEKPNTHNAKKKVENIYAVLPYKVHKYDSEMLFAENMKYTNISEKDWKKIYKDISQYLQFTSESSMQESNKIVLNPEIKALYKAPGYSLAKDGTCFTSIFPEAQNVPARCKTHVLSNGYQLDQHDLSYIQQQNFFENGQIHSLDHTRKAIVVFHSMDKTSLRFVAGELEVSSRIAKALIVETQKFDLDFKDESDIKVEVGVTYQPNFAPFSLGLDINDEDYNIYQLKEIEILSVTPNSMAGNYRITARTVRYAGNSRIISQTGLKGVTKVVADNGYVAFAPKETIVDSMKDKDLGQYLSNRKYNSYRTVEDSALKGWKKRQVDIVTGMNAVKAGSNTIVLAQACLAVELGYYVPSLKGSKKEYAKTLNSLDVNEIQAAADSLPEFVYVNSNGIPSKCFVGLVDIIYTELGSTYAKFKPQSFSFEAGWVIKQNHPELYRHIFDNYLQEDKAAVALEMYKVLQDPRGLLRADEDLPRYNVAQIRKNMFDVKEDLFRQFNSVFKSRSKLLSPEWNPKGFYIDLTKEKGPLIRIPSAQVLNFFVSSLPNGEFSYGEILFSISKIIMAILGRHDGNLAIEGSSFSFNPNLHWIFTNNPTNKRSMLHDAYMKNVKGLVYSSETSHRMLIQAFIKPKIPGVSLKQVVDCLVPDNVIVYLNSHLYKKILYQSGFERMADESEDYIHLLRESSTLSTNDLRLQFKDAVQEVLDDVPLGILNRNPFLWDAQMMLPKIWGPEQFRAYLNICHNIDLDKYLDSFFNRDLIIMSPRTALQSKSDVDGDLAPDMVLNAEGQELAKTFVNKTTPIQELEWLQDYADKEYESDKKLKIDTGHKYVLHTISNKFDITGAKAFNYPQFLLNSTIAKGNIGSATIDCWIIKLLFQCYNALYDQNRGRILDNHGNEIGRMRFRLSQSDANYLAHIYTRLVQERVVEGIKHQTGGSTAFQIYFLKEITNPKNKELVKYQLEHDFNVPVTMISKLLEVIEYCNFDKGLLTACQNFISKYNKGKLPKDPIPLSVWEEFIQKNTYFGSLIDPLFVINARIESLRQQQMEASSNLSQDLLGTDLIGTKSTSSISILDEDDDFKDVIF